MVDVEHFSIEQGLINRDLNTCSIDQKGFIWAASRNGISRFDGVDFKNYKLTSTPFTVGWYSGFQIDVNGKVWLYPMIDCKTVKLVDPETDIQQPFDDYFSGKCPFKAHEIYQIMPGQRRPYVFYIALESGRLFEYDGRFNEITVPDGYNILSESFNFSGPTDHTLWVNRFDFCETDRNGQLECQGRSKVSLAKIFPARGGGHYVVSSWFRIQYLNGADFIFLKKPGLDPQPIRLKLNGKPLQLNEYGTAILSEDGSGWAHSGNLIYRFDQAGQIDLQIALPAPREGGKLPFINAIALQDSGQILWAATQEGLYKVHISVKKFQNHLPGTSIRGMAQVGDRLLINTYKGRMEYRFSTGKVAPSSPLFIGGLGFSEMPDGRLLVGREALSIWVERPGKGIQREFWAGGKSIGAGMDLPFYDPKTGKTWVGSGNGLFLLDPATDSLRHHQKDDRIKTGPIRQFVRSSDGLWIATSSGLFLLGDRDETLYFLDEKSGLPANEVRWLHIDDEGVFWLATNGGGIVRCARTVDDKGRPTLTNLTVFDQRHGFSNNNIYSIIEDRFGFLWLPSDFGLMRFDKKSHRVNTYLPSNGLPHEEFNFLAQYVAADGRIFLGGLNGFTVFQPADFLGEKRKDKPLYLITLNVLDGKTKKLLDRTVTTKQAGEIVLGPDDRFFEAKFALLDYVAPTQNRYAYLIEGLEKDWNPLQGNSLRISGLPPGSYTLCVKAQGSDGQWSDAEIRLPLIIHAPFYQKWQFWSLMFLALALLFLISSRWRIRKMRRDRAVLEQEVASRTATISQQAEALLTLDRAKNRFFENITHEFRTPLTLILGPLRELLKKPETTLENPKLEIAKNNAERLASMVNQFLELAKLEGSELTLRFRQGDLLPILHRSVDQFKPLATKKRVDFIWKTDLTELIGFADRNMLERVVFNLVSNALKFTMPGGRVEVFLEKIENRFSLTVSDTGCGISEADLQHIFDRFFQSESSAERYLEGTGIGLALVKELVERSGGSVFVKSKLGVGSTFWVNLPLELPEGYNQEIGELNGSIFDENQPKMPVPDLEILSKKQQKGQFEPSSFIENVDIDQDFEDNHPQTLLLVEDNAEMREYLKMLLDSAGYSVLEAENGAIGIALARETIPDLVISDVMMPEMDGYELTSVLKNDLLTSHIPIVLLTAKGKAEQKIEGYRRGADAYLPKPFDTEELLVRLCQLLETRRLLQRKFGEAGALSETKDSSEPKILDKKPESNELPGQLSLLDYEFLESLYVRIAAQMADENLTAERIAASFFMSRSQFFSKVKALTGYPPASLIRNIRLDTAHKIICSNPSMRVPEIAQQVGLNDARNFSIIFKKRFGKTPQELRK